MWHSSAARLGKTRTLWFRELTPKQIGKATRVARLMLSGVGADGFRFSTDPPEHAVHYQKPLTEEEIALLPSGWMEIPAVHDVGPRVMF